MDSQKKEQELLLYISNNLDLMSLLFDINLMPEETDGTDKYKTTLLIADAWMNREIGLNLEKYSISRYQDSIFIGREDGESGGFDLAKFEECVDVFFKDNF